MRLDKENRIKFVQGLRLIIKGGYSPKIVTGYAFDFYLNHKISDSKLYELVEDIMIIDAGPEFELSEKELVKLVKDKLEVNIINEQE